MPYGPDSQPDIVMAGDTLRKRLCEAQAGVKLSTWEIRNSIAWLRRAAPSDPHRQLYLDSIPQFWAHRRKCQANARSLRTLIMHRDMGERIFGRAAE